MSSSGGEDLQPSFEQQQIQREKGQGEGDREQSTTNTSTTADSQEQSKSKSSSSSFQEKGMDKLLNKIPNMAPEGPLGTEKKGPLSALGDPLGAALSKTLSPLGHITGEIGNPNGEALLRVQRVAAYEGVGQVGEPKFLPRAEGGGGGGDGRGRMEEGEQEKEEGEGPGGKRIGGREQTGENPLGL